VTDLPVEDPGDPGWGWTWLVLPLSLLPGVGLLLMFLVIVLTRRTGKGTSVLAMLRQVILAFAAVLLLILGVLARLELDVDDPPVSPAVAALVVLVWGLGGLLVSRQAEKELACDDVGALLGSYRTRFFVRLALAESPAMIGFAAAFVTGSLLPYVAGLIPAAIGFARAAPTRTNLTRDDEQLLARGCPDSVYTWLRTAQVGRPSSPDAA
jgi:hypothetical protein